MVFIRDAEVESIIRSFSAPLFRAAGMNPHDVSIRLVKNKTLNAFVAGGRNIFIHTGLIIESEGPDALIGVIAHETGHIQDGHLVRTRATIDTARSIQMIGTVLGVLAAGASGNAAAGSAIALGSQSTSQRIFMAHSRTQESAADQAAMRLLDTTGRTAKGLEDFLGVLKNQNVLSRRLQTPYMQTHPLNQTRIDTLHSFIKKSPNSKHTASKAEILAHARMVAKLYGFIEPLSKVLKRYPESDQSFAGRYARAIAYYRHPDLEKALKILSELMTERPNDPYLFELKGQMLFEHGRQKEALKAYQKSYALAPQEELIVLELARVELEVGGDHLLDKSIEHFKRSISMGHSTNFTWRQLGIAYGRKGKMGLSSLALAEAELRIGQLANSEFLANRALHELDKGTSAHIQAQDILASIKAFRDSKAAEK